MLSLLNSMRDIVDHRTLRASARKNIDLIAARKRRGLNVELEVPFLYIGPVAFVAMRAKYRLDVFDEIDFAGSGRRKLCRVDFFLLAATRNRH